MHLLWSCKSFQDKAEDFIGVKFELRWDGREVRFRDFDAIMEIIAAAFRHEADLRQEKLFDKPRFTEDYIKKEWLSWFDNYIARFLEHTETVKLTMSLASLSSGLYNSGEERPLFQPSAVELASPILTKLSENITTNIKTLHFQDINFQSSYKRDAEKQNKHQRHGACECADIGKTPCQLIPCTTLSKRSAARGIYLE